MDAEGLFHLETRLPEGTLESFKGQGAGEDGWQGEQKWGREFVNVCVGIHFFGRHQSHQDVRHGCRSWSQRFQQMFDVSLLVQMQPAQNR